MQNIEEINLITENNQAKPNYGLENKITSIEVYFSGDGRVLIVGVVDNNYIYWASLTDSNDKEINGAIFDYISRGKIRKTGHLSSAIKAAGLVFEDVMRWVKISLKRRQEDMMSWITPFQGNYSSSQTKNNGMFFARDLAVYIEGIHRKCRYREANGAYEKVLDYYLSVFEEDDGDSRYYYKVKSLIGILETEDYLYGSENSGIRKKYIQLRQMGEKLYNRYMRAAR